LAAIEQYNPTHGWTQATPLASGFSSAAQTGMRA
jgi:hypothetical protein